jgi:hypothetical protein
MANTYRLILNLDDNSLVASLDSRIQLAGPLPVYQGDVLSNFEILTVRRANDESGSAWAPAPLGTGTMKLGVGRLNLAPTSGKGIWQLDDESEPQAAIDFSSTTAQIQSAIRAITGYSAAVVTGDFSGTIVVDRVTLGAPAKSLDLNVSQFLPDCILERDVSRAGTASVSERLRFRVIQDLGTYQDAFSALPASTATVTELQAGGSGDNQRDRVTFSPNPFGGVFQITIDDGVAPVTTAPISINATAAQIQAAIVAAAGAGTAVVARPSFSELNFTIEYVGALADEAITTTIIDDNIISNAGFTGEVLLNTSGIQSLLDQFSESSGLRASVSAPIELEWTPTAGDPSTIYQGVIVVFDDLIEGAANVPTPRASYLTSAQVNAAISAASFGQLETVEIVANTTLDATHVNKLLLVNSSSAITIEIPEFDNEEIPVNSVISIVRFGTGAVDIAVESVAVTLRSAETFKNLRARYSAASLSHLVQDDWLLIGDLS